MNKHYRILVLAILFSSLLLPACTSSTPPVDLPETRDTLYQVSTLNSLVAGNYDGIKTAQDVSTHGDFGIGTFNGLDGEMVMLDGKVYQVKDSGVVEQPADTITLPFTAVTFFDADLTKDLGEIQNYDALKTELDQLITKKDRFYAIKIDGVFGTIKTRSVPKQEKPYPILSEVTKNQPVFDYENVKGSLVGFWCPEYIGSVNAVGYHLHFISENHTQGGHLLDVSFSNASVTLDETRFFEMELGEAAQQDSGVTDAQGEIDKVE